jgi:hypothetical protein
MARLRRSAEKRQVSMGDGRRRASREVGEGGAREREVGRKEIERRGERRVKE